MLEIIVSIIIVLAFVASLLYILHLRKVNLRKDEELAKQKTDYSKLLSQKKSSEIRTGQIVEQLAPFLDNFKYDPKKLHFIGMPIDYIFFGDDEVIIIEVKSGNSQLTPVQKSIKKLIEDGKVRWETYRLNAKKDDPS